MERVGYTVEDKVCGWLRLFPTFVDTHEAKAKIALKKWKRSELRIYQNTVEFLLLVLAPKFECLFGCLVRFQLFFTAVQIFFFLRGWGAATGKLGIPFRICNLFAKFGKSLKINEISKKEEFYCVNFFFCLE